MLNNKLEVSFMKDYLTDVRNEFPTLNDEQIIEDYVSTHLNCLIEESLVYETQSYDFNEFIDSITKLFNTLYNDSQYTNRLIDELTKQHDEYVKQLNK